MAPTRRQLDGAAPPPPMAPGTLLGRVRVGEVVGRGASGTVYRGRHVHLGTDVAIKVLSPRLGYTVEDRNRFLREARTAARLDDPGIVRVFDFGEHGELCYLVMEFIEGGSLEDFIIAGRVPVSERTTAKVLRQIARALRTAHGMGLVHRDLKPANILISRSGILKVVDFGLTRGSGAPAAGPDGLFNGTPAYMAPETATSGARVDQRADLYALGIVAYELVFGRVPYDGELHDILAAHRVGRARFDLPTDGSRALLTVIKRLMDPVPEKRFQSADELLQALGALGDSSERRSGGAASGTSSGGFSTFAHFLEERFGERVTHHPEGRVVHSTMRERTVVWALLAAIVGLAVAGYLGVL